MKGPLVTIDILSFNRKDELRHTLKKVFEQDYKNIEVIVVDNASSDGTKEMVKSEFPSVKLIELTENIGIAGWNKGFEVANGEYVLVLDDDSYPEMDTISLASYKLSTNENVGIIACNVENTLINIIETVDLENRPYSFVGCGALINVVKLKKTGFFDESIFIYFNELDLSARFLNEGFEILYGSECKIIHRQSLNSRGRGNNPFISEYRYINSFWSVSYFLLTKFSFPQILTSYFKWIINRLIISIRYFYILSFIKGLYTVIIRIPIIIKNRKPLKNNVQKIYNYGNIFSWYR